MASSPPSPPANVPPPPGTKQAPPPKREVKIVSHCALFYWWPVWGLGFIMFLITAFTGEYMVTVPPKTTAKPEIVEVEGKKRDAFVLPEGAKLPKDEAHPDTPIQPHLWMSSNQYLGVLFVIIMLLVIVVTNVPFRGLWSGIISIGLLTLWFVFAYFGWWKTIISWFTFLDIRINAAGYLVISVVLFILWLFVFLLFDRQIYLIVTPGQLRVKLEIGGAETIYSTDQMHAEKKPSDFFRHRILGFWGAGDLIIKPAGASEIHFPNVLNITAKIKRIEEMLQIRQVEAAARH